MEKPLLLDALPAFLFFSSASCNFFRRFSSRSLSFCCSSRALRSFSNAVSSFFSSLSLRFASRSRSFSSFIRLRSCCFSSFVLGTTQVAVDAFEGWRRLKKPDVACACDDDEVAVDESERNSGDSSGNAHTLIVFSWQKDRI